MKPLHVLYLGMAISAAVITTIGVGGCASVTPDKRFPDVERLVEDRLGPASTRVHWRLGTPEDEQVDRLVNDLIARPLSADEAVQIALFRNRGLQATFEELGIAQADVVQAGQLRNPDIAGFFRFPDSPPSGLNWNIGVDIWLLDGFLVPIRERLAGAAEQQAIRQVTAQVLGLAAETRAAYYAHQADVRAAKGQDELAEITRLAYDLSRDQTAAGNLDDLGLAAERVAFQQARLAQIQARSTEQASLERLRRLMGLSDQPVNWSLESDAPTPSIGEPGEEELVSLALGSRLDIGAALTEVQRQEYALELTKKWWLSTVQVGVETEKSTDRQFTTGPHFSAELPIFNQRQGEIARQEAIIRQVRHRVASLTEQVRTDVRTALDRVSAARQIAELYAADIIPLRREVFASTEDRYNSMFVGVFELLIAKAELSAAETEYARSLQDYWTARSDLELALGTRIPPAPLAPPAAGQPDAAVPSQPATPTAPANPHQQHPAR